jgi:beta-phosphoglucomutase family hydrolase
MPDGHLGLPSGVRACLFDLDGVITKTAALHARAWQRMFDAYLRARTASTGEPFVGFDVVRDYDLYVDGKPRTEGTRSFLESRGIRLPEGSEDDPPTAETVHGLGNRKNAILLPLIHEEGVQVYAGSVRYLQAVQRADLRTAVVSSSRNCPEVLAAAGIAHFFDARIDGNVAARERLKGKPAPDTYLAAARAVATPPDQAAVFEDALAGVEAGRAGRFGLVVGVDRVGQADLLKSHGADVVVADLSALLDAP